MQDFREKVEFLMEQLLSKDNDFREVTIFLHYLIN